MIIRILFLALLLTNCSVPKVPDVSRPNVLFIAIDDLRPELGCNGNKIVQSPHLDALAGDGLVFNRHYAVVPTCGASRYSLLTGMFPSSRVAAGNQALVKLLAREDEPEVSETLIHHLKRNNYRTIGIGKIAHSADGLVYGYEEKPTQQYELPFSWDEMLFDHGKWGTGWNAFFGYADGSNRQGRNSLVYPYESAPVEDEGYPDGLSTGIALSKLDELAQTDQPFFLGVGFFKPHLPFTAPKKYWDLYNRDDIEISPTPGPQQNVAKASLQTMGEFNRYQLGEEKGSLDSSVSDDYARKLIHAYYACISYTDAQVGKIIKKLKDLDLYENTIIVVWGDHGWNLGDNRLWGKHTLFERSLRSELIIKPPNYDDVPQHIDQIVSSVDLYPTLMDVCGLSMPYSTPGRSLQPVWSDKAESWKNHAFGFFKKGMTLRTERYRVTKYFRDEQPAVEIFDHSTDPYEMKNIAGEDPALMQKLLSELDKGDQGMADW